jgi:hypothetical protein
MLLASKRKEHRGFAQMPFCIASAFFVRRSRTYEKGENMLELMAGLGL